MSFLDILIILGCLALGYWIVSSIMGPGIDLIEAGRKAEELRQQDPQAAKSLPAPTHETPAPKSAMRDWHIVLDVPSNASRAEIKVALKRRLAAAEARGDSAEAERMRRAADYGLRQAR